jgi:CheY-like chemotaxis protein
MMATRVLLVEDDADDRDLFTTFFAERSDISLMPPVTNGLELIAYLKKMPSDHDLPDLIVLDQNMPMMNGKQTLKFLKSDSRFARIPAVIYSTYTDSNLIIDCKKLGASMVAVKPIDQEGYQKMMDDFLQLI